MGEYVKSQPALIKASGVVLLKKAQAELLERENKAIAELRAALGMDGKQPERQSLDVQEEILERTIGAVMHCGVEAVAAEPLLQAGIEMMTEVDKCRQLNAMIEHNLFGSDKALKSFSSLGRQPSIPDDLLQNVVRALFVLLGSPLKSVEDWNKCKKLCSPAGYATLKRRIKECSPLTGGMTERVKVASELLHGYHDYSEMPDDFDAGLACHCWVFGIMSACGMEDPRAHVKETTVGVQEEGGSASSEETDENSSDLSSGSDSEVADDAAIAGNVDEKVQSQSSSAPLASESKAASEESSSSSSSDSSDDSDDDVAGTGGTNESVPPRPKEPTRLKTTPANVVLPDANFKVKLSDSDGESEHSMSETSSSSGSSDDEE